MFGKDCLTRWLQDENTCPVCRYMLFGVPKETSLQTLLQTLQSVTRILEELFRWAHGHAPRPASATVDLARETALSFLRLNLLDCFCEIVSAVVGNNRGSTPEGMSTFMRELFPGGDIQVSQLSRGESHDNLVIPVVIMDVRRIETAGGSVGVRIRIQMS